MTSEAFIGLIMLLILLGAIFVGVPISFTLLFLALAFGWLGLGDTVFNLAYFQTIGMMKEEVLAAVPLFILMGFVTQQAGLMERLFIAFRHLLAPMRGSLYVVVVMTAAQSARKWAEEIGADGFVSKPFGANELLTSVEKLCNCPPPH